jgi:hypothetical protein
MSTTKEVDFTALYSQGDLVVGLRKIKIGGIDS